MTGVNELMSKREADTSVDERGCAPEIACLWFKIEDEATKNFGEYVIWLARQEGVFEAKEAVRQQQRHRTRRTQSNPG